MLEFDIPIKRGSFNAHFRAQIDNGKVTAFFGESGVGKSSLLRALVGLDRHQNARVISAGTVWQSDTQWVLPEHRQIAYCAQTPQLFTHLDAGANIAYAMARASNTKPKLTVEELAQIFGITNLLNHYPDQLSGGEKQRVVLARAFARAPQLILLDEAFSGLDTPTRHTLLLVVKQLAAELAIPIIVVTHSIDEVSLVADDLVLLGDGGVISSGSTNDMLTRLDLPLAHLSEARSLVMANVVGHDHEFSLTYLENSAGRFSILRQTMQIGQSARLGIAARDVSLSLSDNTDSSILNRIRVKVRDTADSGPGQLLVLLEAGDHRFLARITQKSAAQLNVRKGLSLILQAKSIALY